MFHQLISNYMNIISLIPSSLQQKEMKIMAQYIEISPYLVLFIAQLSNIDIIDIVIEEIGFVISEKRSEIWTFKDNFPFYKVPFA